MLTARLPGTGISFQQAIPHIAERLPAFRDVTNDGNGDEGAKRAFLARLSLRTARIKALLALLVCTSSHPCIALDFTGDAEVDFPEASPSVVVVADGLVPDVGLPPEFPFQFSGWDVKDVRFVWMNDTLFVGVNTFGIAGDADGDGDPSNASLSLVRRGGADTANYAQSEHIAVAFDLNQDGVFDMVVGKSPESSQGIGTFKTAVWLEGGIPPLVFGTALAEHTGPTPVSPSASQPDLQFSIPRFTEIAERLGIAETDVLQFTMSLYHGSYQDSAQIGEESMNDRPVVLKILPEIVSHPDDLTGVPGGTATFEAEVFPSSPSLRYQWFKNGDRIPRATNRVLTLSPLSGNDAGDYSVQIDGGAGIATSDPATLTISRTASSGKKLVLRLSKTQLNTISDKVALASRSKLSGKSLRVEYQVKGPGEKEFSRWDAKRLRISRSRLRLMLPNLGLGEYEFRLKVTELNYSDAVVSFVVNRADQRSAPLPFPPRLQGGEVREEGTSAAPRFR